MTIQSVSKGDVASEVRAEAARQQISGRELARRLDCKPVYIARRLSGEVDFSSTDLRRVADILAVPVSQFFGEATLPALAAEKTEAVAS